MKTELSAKKNHLLLALTDKEWQRLSPHFELVSVLLGQVIYESGQPSNYVYFPLNAIISLLYVTKSGSSSEIAIVGKEGIVGPSIFMGGGGSNVNRAVVQSAGYCIRLKNKALTDEFEHFSAFMHLLLRYTQALMSQISQTAVCNRHHSLDQQLCRWLLLSMDCLDGNDTRADIKYAWCAS